MAYNEDDGLTEVDTEAQTHPKEKLLGPTSLITQPLTLQQPCPIISIRGSWTLIRLSNHSSHNLLSSLSILLSWHCFGQLIIAFLTFLPTIFKRDHGERHAFCYREPMSFLEILRLAWQTICFVLAGVFVIMCLRRSISGSCGCTARARQYGARWLWPSFYETANKCDDLSMFSMELLGKVFRETTWAFARIHEVAWSVAFTMVWWNVFLTSHNWLIPTEGFFTGMHIDEARRYVSENRAFRGVLAAWVTAYFTLIFSVWASQGLLFTDCIITYQCSKPTMSSLRSALTKVAENYKGPIDVEMVMREIAKERAMNVRRDLGATSMNFETCEPPFCSLV